MIKADLSDLDHRFRAKRSGWVTPAEYASSIHGFKRRTNWATRIAYGVAVVLVIGALAMLGAAR